MQDELIRQQTEIILQPGSQHDHAEVQDLAEIKKVAKHQSKKAAEQAAARRVAAKKWMKSNLSSALTEYNSIKAQKQRNKRQQSETTCTSTTETSTTPSSKSAEDSPPSDSKQSSQLTETYDSQTPAVLNTNLPSVGDPADTETSSESKSP